MAECGSCLKLPVLYTTPGIGLDFGNSKPTYGLGAVNHGVDFGPIVAYEGGWGFPVEVGLLSTP